MEQLDRLLGGSICALERMVLAGPLDQPRRAGQDLLERLLGLLRGIRLLVRNSLYWEAGAVGRVLCELAILAHWISDDPSRFAKVERRAISLTDKYQRSVSKYGVGRSGLDEVLAQAGIAGEPTEDMSWEGLARACHLQEFYDFTYRHMNIYGHCDPRSIGSLGRGLEGFIELPIVWATFEAIAAVARLSGRAMPVGIRSELRHRMDELNTPPTGLP